MTGFGNSILVFLLLFVVNIGSALPYTFKLLNKDPSKYIADHIDGIIYYDSTDPENYDFLQGFLQIKEGQLNKREIVFREIALYQSERPISLNTAFNHLERAAKLADELPDSDLLKGLVLQEFGIFLAVNHAYVQAIENITKSIKILSPFVAPQTIFNLNSRICNIYINIGEKDSTKVIFDRLLNFTKDYDDRIIHASANNNYGLYLTDQQDYDSAIKFFHHGIDFLSDKNSGEHHFIANIKESMSHALFYSNQREEAIQLLEETLQIRERYKDERGIFIAFNYIVDYLEEMGDKKRAIQIFKQYQSILDHPTRTKLDKIYFSGRAKIYRFMNKHDLAQKLRNQEVEQTLIENKEKARFSSQRTSMNAFISAKNNLMKAELANQILQRKKETQNRSIVQLIFLSLLIIASILFWFYRQRVKVQRIAQARLLEIANQKKEILTLKNQNLEYDMQVKEHDLSMIAADNRLRTSMKKDFLKKLKSLDRLLPDQIKRELGKLQNEVEQTIESQEKLNLLQEHVKDINAAFEIELREKIPGITPSEIQLCSYLKLGMNNNEIANLTSKSVGTIRVYRSRLRKKANIATSHDFEAFLKAL